MFKVVHEIRARETRQSTGLNIYLPKSRLELTTRSFLYRGPILWNMLPQHIERAPTLNCFKTLLDELYATHTTLLERLYYQRTLLVAIPVFNITKLLYH